jgi:hypothetical protein
MKLMNRARAGHLVTLASGIAIGLATVGTAAAASSAPAPAVTHHYTIAASAFAPDGLHTTTEDYFNQWDPSTLSNAYSGRCFNAGLALPVGATLTSVTVYYTAGSAAMYVELNRQELSNHSAANFASFDTATATTPAYTSTTETIPSADAVVNMGKYAYSAGVCPSGTTTFSGLNITYTQPG